MGRLRSRWAARNRRTVTRNHAQPRGRRRTRRLPAPAGSKVWAGAVGDQGTTSACTGFAVATMIATHRDLTPAQVTDLGHEVYQWRLNDARHQADHPGAPTAALYPLVHGYATDWATPATVDDIAAAITAHGPVYAALPWHHSMRAPNRRGDITVRPVAQPGYHAVALVGYDPARPYRNGTQPAYCIANSYGTRWGVDGRAWITAADLARLLPDPADWCVYLTGWTPTN